MSAARNAEPIPKATTSARVDSGRAMSGRIGISLASTVSSVIDVPATHSSGVKLICPAWTEAISSSVEAKTLAAGRCDVRLVGLDEDARPDRGDDDDDRDQRRRSPRSSRPAGRGDPAPAERRSRRVAFTSARTATRTRRPEQRDQDERHDQAAEDRADRVRREQSAGALGRHAIASSSRSAEVRREGDPECDRHGQHDEERRPEQRPEGLDRLARRRGTWPRRGRSTSPAIASAPAMTWLAASSRTGSPDPRAQDREEDRAQRDPDEEGRQDRREDVGRVARPRGEQPRPGDLVAERRQAGDEGDGQGEPRDGSELSGGPVGGRSGATGAGAGPRAVSIGRSSARRDGARRRGPATARPAPPRPSSRPRPPAPRTARAARSGRSPPRPSRRWPRPCSPRTGG